MWRAPEPGRIVSLAPGVRDGREPARRRLPGSPSSSGRGYPTRGASFNANDDRELE